MREKLLIKGATLYIPSEDRFDVRDIYIEQVSGKNVIKAVEPYIEAEGIDVYDAFGAFVMPSFTDLWSRMGEPDGEKRESFSTGSNAAVNGGYGHLLVAPYGKPITDDPGVLLERRSKADGSARCEIKFCGSLTASCLGKKLTDHAALKNAGAVAFSDGMLEKMPDDLLREAMISVAGIDGLVIAMPRLSQYYPDAHVNLGRASGFLNIKGIPWTAEVLDITRYLLCAAETGCRVHIAGVSTEQGIEAIFNAKKHGVPVTASAFPANYSFSEDDLFFYGSMAKVWPPLRKLSDVNALRSALRDGTIDCVSSCHTPLSDADKTDDIAASKFGVTGLQTAFSSAATYLFPGDTVDKLRLTELFSYAPSNILGLDIGTIAPGCRADLCMVSFDRDFTVSESFLKSRSGNSVFKGLTLRGSVEKTILPTGAL